MGLKWFSQHNAVNFSCFNRARQAATTGSDADYQKAIERLVREIHHVTPSKRKLFNKLFQHDDQQLLLEVKTNATGPRSIFAK